MIPRLLVFTSMVLLSCNAPRSEETRDSLAKDSSAIVASENMEEATSSEAGYTGIIVANDVPIWADTSRSEEYIAMVNLGEQVVLLNEYPGFVNPWKDEETPFCDQSGYHFYDVRVIQGGQEINGVMYGSNVFLDPQGYEAFRGIQPNVVEKQIVIIGGIKYEFGVVLSDGIGPSDANGLTGCDDTYVPYFRNVMTDAISFINVQGDSPLIEGGDSHMRMRNGFLELVWGSEGGSTSIKTIDQAKCNGEWSVVFELESGYQDGSATFTMCVTHADGVFNLLTVYNN